jgi:hypothetical protein
MFVLFEDTNGREHLTNTDLIVQIVKTSHHCDVKLFNGKSFMITDYVYKKFASKTTHNRFCNGPDYVIDDK